MLTVTWTLECDAPHCRAKKSMHLDHDCTPTALLFLVDEARGEGWNVDNDNALCWCPDHSEARGLT